MDTQERLTIREFFSIKVFDWDIKGFNILTGKMASGKSIALKLLYFCEQVIHRVIFYDSIDREIFTKNIFFEKVEKEFDSIFVSRSSGDDFRNTKIAYKYFSSNKNDPGLFDQAAANVFDLTAEWNTETERLQWTSKYIESRLGQWQKYFEEPNTPDLIESVRNRIHESILSDFSGEFPLAAMFIPASRAIAAIANSVSSRDQFIGDFMELRNFALSFNEIGDISSEAVNKILYVKNILMSKNDKQPVFELPNKRRISSLELSSGQQELLCLLLLINDLPKTRFRYGKMASIFIEEPSAHLFPEEQKKTVEYLAANFNKLRKNANSGPGYRFFISTHSPYVLNTINNILEKGRLLKIAEGIGDAAAKKAMRDELDKLAFPCLSIGDVSAYMIEDTGFVKSIINIHDDDSYIYSEAFERITEQITSETDRLYELSKVMKTLVRQPEAEN
jgi:AAA15 family ATPase/GTPase